MYLNVQVRPRVSNVYLRRRKCNNGFNMQMKWYCALCLSAIFYKKFTVLCSVDEFIEREKREIAFLISNYRG